MIKERADFNGCKNILQHLTEDVSDEVLVNIPCRCNNPLPQRLRNLVLCRLRLQTSHHYQDQCGFISKTLINKRGENDVFSRDNGL